MGFDLTIKSFFFTLSFSFTSKSDMDPDSNAWILMFWPAATTLPVPIVTKSRVVKYAQIPKTTTSAHIMNIVKCSRK